MAAFCVCSNCCENAERTVLYCAFSKSLPDLYSSAMFFSASLGSAARQVAAAAIKIASTLHKPAERLVFMATTPCAQMAIDGPILLSRAGETRARRNKTERRDGI